MPGSVITISSTEEEAGMPFQDKSETNFVNVVEFIHKYFFNILNAIPETPKAWKVCEQNIENVFKDELVMPKYSMLYKKIVVELMYIKVPECSDMFVRLLKDLLERTKPELKRLFNVYERCRLLDHINICGDYYMQNVLMQIIIYSGIDEMKENLRATIPDNSILRDEFERIRLEYIEQDIRKYLNAVNECYKLVISVWAMTIYVNSTQIPDLPSGGVWVDFSKSTKVISFSLQLPTETYVAFGQGDVKDWKFLTETESYSLTLNMNSDINTKNPSLYDLNSAKEVKFVFKGVQNSDVEHFFRDIFSTTQTNNLSKEIPSNFNTLIGKSSSISLHTAEVLSYPTQLLQALNEELEIIRTTSLTRRNKSTQDYRPVSRRPGAASSSISTVSNNSGFSLSRVMIADKNLLDNQHSDSEVIYISNSQEKEQSDLEIISWTVETADNQNKDNDDANANRQKAEAAGGTDGIHTEVTQNMVYDTNEDVDISCNVNDIFQQSTQDHVIIEENNNEIPEIDIPLDLTCHKRHENEIALQVIQIPHQSISKDEVNPVTTENENVITSDSQSKLNITVIENIVIGHKKEELAVQEQPESGFAVPATPLSVLRRNSTKSRGREAVAGSSTSVNSISQSVSENSSVNKKMKIASNTSTGTKKNTNMTGQENERQKYCAAGSSNVRPARLSNAEEKDINNSEQVEMSHNTQVGRYCRYMDECIKLSEMAIKCFKRSKYCVLMKD